MLQLLQSARTPLTAAELAGRLALPGCRETQRRQIRALVAALREQGSWIVATLSGGYWLTRDAALWREYNEHRKIDSKRVLGEAHRRQRQAADAGGQYLLFGPPTPVGGWS